MTNLYHQQTQFSQNSQTNDRVTAKLEQPRQILAEIFNYKFQEVAMRIKQLPLKDVKNRLDRAPDPRDFLSALQQSPTKPSLIAEVKKASPSKGVIRPDFDPIKIAQAYQKGGASCLSVLTDEKFFQGGFENLQKIRQKVELPLLCKEFIVDPYQIYLARTNGADAILLIAAILSDRGLQEFLELAKSLGMNALIEVHTFTELDRVLNLPNVRLVGINNRNLQDFTVDLGTTENLIEQRREQITNLGITVVSESGLYTPKDLAKVRSIGADAVLVGESLLRQTNLEQAVQHLLAVDNFE